MPEIVTPDFFSTYSTSIGKIRGEELSLLLAKGREICERHNLTSIINNGGSLAFSHMGLFESGPETAACIEAFLNSDAEELIFIGVRHARTKVLKEARDRVAKGTSDLTAESSRGITTVEYYAGGHIEENVGPEGEHSALVFRRLLEARAQELGPELRQRRVTELFPWLVGGEPQSMPGASLHKKMADSHKVAIIYTADPFHHGIAYGTPPELAVPFEAEGRQLAIDHIEKGMKLLERGDLRGHTEHCVGISDARDVEEYFRYLKDRMTGRILELSATDMAPVYQCDSPSWVAGGLMCWEKTAT